MSRDSYRDWTSSDRSDAWRDRDLDGCRRYDEDFESSERAYDQWRSGGAFEDPEPDNRFS